MATFDKYNQFTIPEVTFANTIPETKTVNFEAPDVNIFARSMQLNEQRAINANVADASFEKAIQQMATNIGNDEESINWLNNLANTKRQEIADYINRGDYHNARLIATKAADEILNNPDYLNRKAHWESYKTQRDDIEKRTDISDIRKKRWLEFNPYRYEYTEDGVYKSKGDAAQGRPAFSYVAPDIVWNEFFQKALNLARPDVSTESSQNRHTSGTSNKTETGTSTGSTRMFGKSESLTITNLPPERIKESVAQLIHDGDVQEQIYQDLDDNIYRAKKLDEEIAKLPEGSPARKRLEDQRSNLNWIFDQGGVPITLESYVAKQFDKWYETAKQYDVQHAKGTESGRTNEIDNYVPNTGAQDNNGLTAGNWIYQGNFNGTNVYTQQLDGDRYNVKYGDKYSTMSGGALKGLLTIIK